MLRIRMPRLYQGSWFEVPRPPLKPGDRIRVCINAAEPCNWAYATGPRIVVHVEPNRVDYEVFPFRAIYSTRSWIRVP